MRRAHAKNSIILPLVLAIAVGMGLVLEIWWDGHLAPGPWSGIVGGVLIVGGTILLVWAEQVRMAMLAVDDPEPGLLLRGAYRLTRFPSQVAMFLMTFGLAALLNSLPVFCTVLMVLIVTKILLLPQEDAFMHKRFGKHYEHYRKGGHKK